MGLPNPLRPCRGFSEAISHPAPSRASLCSLCQGRSHFPGQKQIKSSPFTLCFQPCRAGRARSSGEPQLSLSSRCRRSPVRLRLNRDVSGIKAHTFTALAVLTNQKSYLTHDTCDCLNNITAHAASLPPRTHSLPAHTHGISNRIASPPPSLSPAFTICRSPICPLCSIFPSNIPPPAPSPPLQPPALLPRSSPSPGALRWHPDLGSVDTQSTWAG